MMGHMTGHMVCHMIYKGARQGYLTNSMHELAIRPKALLSLKDDIWKQIRRAV